MAMKIKMADKRKKTVKKLKPKVKKRSKNIKKIKINKVEAQRQDAEIQERLSQVIMDAMSTIDIDSMTQNEKLKLIQIGLTYVIPRLKQIEDVSDEMPTNFQIEIIDSLSKYSNDELDKAIKN